MDCWTLRVQCPVPDMMVRTKAACHPLRWANTSEPQDATVSELAALYIDAPSFGAGGPPAHLALFRRRLHQDPGMTMVAWGDRASARMAEIHAQQDEVCDSMQLLQSGPDQEQS